MTKQPGDTSSNRNSSNRWAVAGLVCLACAVAAILVFKPDPGSKLRAELQGERLKKILSLSPVPPPPPDPSNAYADDPKAAALGHRLFFDTRLSGTGTVSCATCHQPKHALTSPTPKSQGLGMTERNAPGLLGIAHQRWFYWDGRKDSLWAQCTEPLEHPAEHGTSRTAVVQLLSQHYRQEYEAIFGTLPAAKILKELDARARPDPDAPKSPHHLAWQSFSPKLQEELTRGFVNLCKAVGAYQRKLQPMNSPFDDYVAARRAGDPTGGNHISRQAERGLELFVDRAKCILCHNGPMLSDRSFHNLGLPSQSALSRCQTHNCLPDQGREHGAEELLKDEFNCNSSHSDAKECKELGYLNASFEDFKGAFKTPSLRSVKETAPYMHSGEFSDLKAVMTFYNTLPGEADYGHRELFLRPLKLRPVDLRDIIAFMESLSSPENPWAKPP